MVFRAALPLSRARLGNLSGNFTNLNLQFRQAVLAETCVEPAWNGTPSDVLYLPGCTTSHETSSCAAAPSVGVSRSQFVSWSIPQSRAGRPKLGPQGPRPQGSGHGRAVEQGNTNFVHRESSGEVTHLLHD